MALIHSFYCFCTFPVFSRCPHSCVFRWDIIIDTRINRWWTRRVPQETPHCVLRIRYSSEEKKHLHCWRKLINNMCMFFITEHVMLCMCVIPAELLTRQASELLLNHPGPKSRLDLTKPVLSGCYSIYSLLCPFKWQN